MWQLDQNQMRMVNTLTTVVKVVAVASSTFSCFNLLALASITIKHRLAQKLVLPHLLTGYLSAINLFLLPWAILLFQPLPLPLDFPSVGLLGTPDLPVQTPAPGAGFPDLSCPKGGGEKGVWVICLEEHCARY